MKNRKNVETSLDAFISLRDVGDEDVAYMLKKKEFEDKRLQEAYEFEVSNWADMSDARDFLDAQNKPSDDVEIEVIDADADAVEHVKDNKEYLGQAILQCCRCHAKKFIDLDKLVVDEKSDVDQEDAEETLYNLDDECPNCHANAGYELIGQVGKVVEPEEEVAEVEVENDVAPEEDEATFDNDAEIEAAGEEEKAEEEPEALPEFNPDEDTFEEEPESDGTETDEVEDEEDLFDIDAVKPEEEEEEEDKEEAKESLNEDLTQSEFADKAWMLNRIIAAMNNENAYFGSWLYIWPDGETYEDCLYDFESQEDFDELFETFERVYRRYHSGGLYAAPEDVVAAAHEYDKQFGLKPIENIPQVSSVGESRECREYNNCTQLLECVNNPDHVSKIIVRECLDGQCHELYNGPYYDFPADLKNRECTSFNVDRDPLVCYIDSDCEQPVNTLDKALDKYQGKVDVCDLAGDYNFCGDKQDAVDKFGSCEVCSFETPKIIVINLSDDKCCEDECEDISDEEGLVGVILDRNNLSRLQLDSPESEERWIHDTIVDRDPYDLTEVYKEYIMPQHDASLTESFKSITGYKDSVEEAVEQLYGKQSFASRKELAEAIEVCKNNNQPYSVSKSKDENYRYDLKVEEAADDEKAEIVNDEAAEADVDDVIEIVDDVEVETAEDSIEDTAEEKSMKDEFIEELYRIASTIAAAVTAEYETEICQITLVAEMLADLGVVGDVEFSALTSEAFETFDTLEILSDIDTFKAALDHIIELTAEKKELEEDDTLAGALDRLRSEEFTEEAINEKVKSEEFEAAADAGQFLFIINTDTEEEEASDDEVEAETEDVEETDTTEDEDTADEELTEAVAEDTELSGEEIKEIAGKIANVFTSREGTDDNRAKLAADIIEAVPEENIDEVIEAIKKVIGNKELSEKAIEALASKTDKDISAVKTYGDLIKAFLDNPDANKAAKTLALTIMGVIAVVEPTVVGEIITAVLALIPAGKFLKILSAILMPFPTLLLYINKKLHRDEDDKLQESNSQQLRAKLAQLLTAAPASDSPEETNDEVEEGLLGGDVNLNISGNSLLGNGNSLLSRALGEDTSEDETDEIEEGIIGGDINLNLTGNSLLGNNNSMLTKTVTESVEDIDFDVDLFDDDLNKYLEETYPEDHFEYYTETGSIDENGVITLNGVISDAEGQDDMVFTLTPIDEVGEDGLAKTYHVENSLSDEIFEFSLF